MGTDRSTSCSALRGCWRWLCPTTSSTFELLCRRAQLIIRAHFYDAQRPQRAGSEFNVDGLDTDALDALLPKSVTEAVKSRTKQAESLAPVAENKVMLHRVGKKGGAKEA